MKYLLLVFIISLSSQANDKTWFCSSSCVNIGSSYIDHQGNVTGQSGVSLMHAFQDMRRQCSGDLVTHFQGESYQRYFYRRTFTFYRNGFWYSRYYSHDEDIYYEFTSASPFNKQVCNQVEIDHNAPRKYIGNRKVKG